jgi:periplasmic divalent cation tolerance protein
MEFRSLYITVGRKDEARAIATALVGERLVACTNLFDGVESQYWWEGKIATDREVVIVAKTRADLVDAAIARVRALHSYKVPCIVALPILAGNPAYLDWIAAETGR